MKKTNILTKEDKETLSGISRYLKSHNFKEGDIEIEVEGSFPDFDEITRLQSFTNAWDVEIPKEYFSILEKIWDQVESSYRDIDVDNINYERIFITLDVVGKQLTIAQYYSYYEEEESDTTSWDINGEEQSDENLAQIFLTLKELYPNERYLNMRYNGSGDSGYLEDYFEEGGDSIPESVQNWGYNMLENLHGGWEINEGSQGVFQFDLKKGTVNLYHTFNEEIQDSNTLFEEKF